MIHLIDSAGSAWSVPETGADLFISHPTNKDTQILMHRPGFQPVILWAGLTDTARLMVPVILRRIADACAGDSIRLEDIEAEVSR